VCITKSVRGDVNLGIYRVQFVDEFKARIFLDPRTDGHRNWMEALDAGHRLEATVFLGSNPALLLAGASRLPQTGDDFELASRLLGDILVLDAETNAPIDSTAVIRGDVGAELEEEGPFAEFKGYYVPARMSPVFHVNYVGVSGDSPFYPTIVTGAESGLSLMALQNEYLMHSHLRELGYRVNDVSYPLAARSEFVCLISSPDSSPDLLHDAMAFDLRAKLVACGDVADFPLALASHGFTATQCAYHSKGRRHGDRVGIVLDRPPAGAPVEF
jgi:4-hydroxy-3-polyprenylbenzoate decarboxylase